jgi:hypothetical protein
VQIIEQVIMPPQPSSMVPQFFPSDAQVAGLQPH